MVPNSVARSTSSVRVVPSTLQAAPAEVFDGLKAGDVLFIDSSHILMPGSDVDILLNRVLPRLPAGVLVHIHDIFLPFDYPAIWGWRNYNEQQGVVPLLAGPIGRRGVSLIPSTPRGCYGGRGRRG